LELTFFDRPNTVEGIIHSMKSDGIFLSFGVQAALDSGIRLHESGFLEGNNSLRVIRKDIIN
jgi:hypothetical protein